MSARRIASAASDLDGLPGMVGALRGVRRRGQAWTTEPTLTILVRRKVSCSRLPRDQRIPRTIRGVPTDVIAVGRPRAYADGHGAIDTTDRLLAEYDTSGRKSAVSALAENPAGGVIALGSGHGLLPVADGAFVSGRWGRGARPVAVLDEQVHAGSLWFGEVGSDKDFAVVSFPELSAPSALPGHTLAAAPIEIAPRRISKHAIVQHVAPRRGYRIVGHVVADSVPGMILRLRSDLGIVTAYADVLAVVGESIRFSIPGESGSLVFDDRRRAVGFVVGGGADPDDPGRDITFVLRDFAAVRGALGRLFPLFFKGSLS